MVEQSEFRKVIKVAILKRNIFVRIYKTDITLSIFFRYKITSGFVDLFFYQIYYLRWKTIEQLIEYKQWIMK